MDSVMGGRAMHLEQALAGYQKTRVSLVEFDGTQFVSSLAGDDIGIYVLIPKLTEWLHVSLDTSMRLFFYGLPMISFLLGFIGFVFLYKSWTEKFIAYVGLLLLTMFSIKIGDVYIFYSACAIALVPWALYFSSKPDKKSSFIFIFFAGLIGGMSHYIRAYSAIGTLACIITLYCFKKIPLKKKLFLFTVCLSGFLISCTYFDNVYNTYVSYSQDNCQGCPLAERKHVFWHSVYLGFGFLGFNNEEEICYLDSYAAEKVKSINPQVAYCSSEYESILKHEVFNFIKRHTLFSIFTLFAKIGVLLFYLLLFANIGLVIALFYKKPWRTEVALWAALCLNALFPLLTLPIQAYSVGFITFATLYGIISINYAFSQGLLHDCRKTISHYIQIIISLVRYYKVRISIFK